MEKIKDIATDLIDIGLKISIDTDIVKEIPILGTLNKVLSAYKEIKDVLLKQRLLDFFNELESLSKEEKENFSKKIKSDTDYNRIHFTIISIIDNIDEDGKEKIHGRLFKALIKGDITLDEFKMLSVIVNKSFLIDMTNFINYYTYNKEGSHHLDEYRYNRLMSNGLLNIKNVDLHRQELKDKYARRNSSSNSRYDNKLNYELSNLGHKLINSFK